MSVPERVHIVGIGGIGLSALARLLVAQGKIVSGCDRACSIVTEGLNQVGIETAPCHDVCHVTPDTDLLIYSDAVPEDNEERAQARALGIPELSYFQALGADANRYKVIAVSGAHGKTTTTAMLADVLEAGGLDPTSVVGSLRAKTKSNFHAGTGDYFVVEADEYRRHFLEFIPHVLIITNIDADHLDYYKDLPDVQSAFLELALKVPEDGFVICDPKNEKVRPVIEGIAGTVVDYTQYYDPALPLQVLPLHRINAAAVLAASDVLGVPPDVAREAIGSFTGTWRRFERKGVTRSGAVVYDDYGHHPTEVKATLESARRQFENKRIIVAFQPHLYSRTKLLMREFSHAFGAVDEVMLAPIYAAREAHDPTVSSETLAEKIREDGTQAQAFESLGAMEKYLLDTAGEGDIIITMGAGDIYKVGEAIIDPERSSAL
ncbi:MAG TPA: UDP-N-acetylmuramate--L-alanine ligase [Candidatus Paceibacterota bacterium]